MSRLFLAIDLPGELRRKLTTLDPRIPGLRWSPKGQLHLTLAFLGMVEPAVEEGLCRALAGIHAEPFTLTLRDVGTFGGPHPMIVWAGIDQEPLLKSLQFQISEIATKLKLTAATKPFHPHVTVGRPHGISRSRLIPFLQAHAGECFGSWNVTDYKLFGSELTPQGAIHTLRQTWPLGR